MELSQITKIAKALADKTRLKVFEAISARGEMNCGEIVSMGGVTHATISHHLKVLQEAGLIECERIGQFVYSRSCPKTIKGYVGTLEKMANGKTRRQR